MSDSLLIFTVGPVQGFIAEARRTHDLWAGSQILVELIKKAAQAARSVGAQIIFPSNLDRRSLPNRFVARIPSTVAATDVIEAAEGAVRKQWLDYANSARERLEEKYPIDDEWTTVWDRQIGNHLEVFWCFGPEPATDAPDRYSQWYRHVSEGLGARKQTRDFGPSEEQGPKDSLSGARSALTVKGKSPKEYWSAIAAAFDAENLPLLRPDGRERLDAIGAIKRFTRFPDSARFPSVSSIAAAGFRRVVRARGLEGLLTDYGHTLGALGIFKPGDALKSNALAPWDFDGDMLYLETLRPRALEDDYHKMIAENDSRLATARSALGTLHAAVGSTPSTYYAILAMDGDRMGARVGACQNEDEHRALSDALAQFARRATDIVETTFAGSVVYAGGDDLLALLPLIDALPAARAVRAAFAEMVSPSTTISAGIALAHHQSPLDAVLQAARDAEEIAKHEYGRDALCIVALKRSGERVRVGAKWDFGDKLQVVENIVKAIQDDDRPLSPKFAFEAYAEARALSGLPEAYARRIRWLVGRHAPKRPPGEADELAGQITAMAGRLDTLFSQTEDDERRGTVEMADWLLIARFLAQGGRE